MSNSEQLDPWAPTTPPNTNTSPASEKTEYKHSETSKKNQKKEPVNPVKEGGEPAVKDNGKFAIDGKLNTDLHETPKAPLPNFPPVTSLESFAPAAELDFSDMAKLNNQIVLTRRRMFLVQNQLREAERAAVEADANYRMAYARELVKLSGGSERQRLAVADIRTEEEWGDKLVKEQVAKEFVSLLRAIRSDVDILMTLANNIRAQIQML